MPELKAALKMYEKFGWEYLKDRWEIAGIPGVVCG